MAQWSTRKLPDGDVEYHDGTRVRAILQHRHRKLWLVHRIDSRGVNMGCDSFFRRSEAVDFIVNGRVFR